MTARARDRDGRPRARAAARDPLSDVSRALRERRRLRAARAHRARRGARRRPTGTRISAAGSASGTAPCAPTAWPASSWRSPASPAPPPRSPTRSSRPGRWLTALGGVLLLAVAVAIGADNAFLFFLAWETLTVCIYLIASADRDQPRASCSPATSPRGSPRSAAPRCSPRSGCCTPTPTASRSPSGHTRRCAPGRAGSLFALLLVAFGTKIGVVPVQGGLPAGYGAAPRLGAASLSVALSAGFYGLWRFVLAILGAAADLVRRRAAGRSAP